MRATNNGAFLTGRVGQGAPHMRMMAAELQLIC